MFVKHVMDAKSVALVLIVILVKFVILDVMDIKGEIMGTCINCYECQVNYNGGQQKLCGDGRSNRLNQPNLPPKLNHMSIWNTSRCNLACEYCFVFKREKIQPVLDIEDKVIQALPEFYEKHFNTQITNFIYFFGGEPLVAFDKIQAVYNIMKPYKINWSFTSNLTLLTEEKGEWLGERGFKVLCSIDGIKEAQKHRIYKNGENSWDKTIAGLGMVKKHMLGNPEIRGTVSPDTIKYVYDSVMYFIESGASFIAMEPVFEMEWTTEQIAELVEQHRRVSEFISHHRSREIEYKPLRDVKTNLKMLSSNNNQHWKTRCGLGQSGVGMDTDGGIYGCHRFVCDRLPENKIGSVFTGIDNAARENFIHNATVSRPHNIIDSEKCNHSLAKGLTLNVPVSAAAASVAVPMAWDKMEKAAGTPPGKEKSG